MQSLSFTGLNFGDAEEVRRIAQLHLRAPLDWIQGYEVKDEAVEQTFKVLTESSANPKTHVIVARANTKLIGFHWISVVDEQLPSGRIESLWVDEAQRRRGIARQLKKHGEAWFKEQGVKRITTKVFYVNQKMIELNLKEGFTAGQVTMTKEL